MPASRTVTRRPSQSALPSLRRRARDPRVRTSPPRLIAALSKRSHRRSASHPLPTPPRSIAQPAARRAHPPPPRARSAVAGTASARRCTCWKRRMAPHLGDGPVVPRVDERRKAGGVDEAVAQRVRVDADAEQFAEQRRTPPLERRRRIETRQLAAGVESREPAFESVGVRDHRRNVAVVRGANDDLASRAAECGENMTGGAVADGAHET